MKSCNNSIEKLQFRAAVVIFIMATAGCATPQRMTSAPTIPEQERFTYRATEYNEAGAVKSGTVNVQVRYSDGLAIVTVSAVPQLQQIERGWPPAGSGMA